jgi:plastocyanin
MNNRRLVVMAATTCAVLVTVLIGASADQDLTDQPAVPDAVVNFGSVPPQPAPPANHVLVPNEVTIFKGGTVTFIVNGGAHGIAVYPVSKNTTHAHTEEDLCQGGPAVCNGPATATLQYFIRDGDGNLVIDTGTNPPQNRVDYAPGQHFSAGAGVFLVGSTTTTVGTQVRYRFAEDGRRGCPVGC